jgi:hypothetical protein
MSNQPQAVSGQESFRAAYARHFGCAEEVFEEKLFWQCLSPLARPVATLADLVTPTFYNPDFDCLRLVGDALDMDEIRVEANKLREAWHLRKGLVRGLLRARLSGRRLIAIAESVWRPPRSRGADTVGRAPASQRRSQRR